MRTSMKKGGSAAPIRQMHFKTGSSDPMFTVSCRIAMLKLECL
jgi:hypothetical protein